MNHTTLLFLCCAIGAAAPLAAQDLDDGLRVHYNFEDNLIEEKTGQTAETQGTFSYEDGIDGKAIRYAFPDNYFLTPAGEIVPGNTPTSYALFVNHNPAVIGKQRMNYLQQLNGDGETGRATLYLQRPDSPTNPDTIISFVGNGTTTSNYKMTEGGTWFHLALTIDPSNGEFVFYVNGAMVNRDTMPKTIEPATGSYVVGHHKGLSTNTITFNGLMDDLRMYDRLLSPEEVRLLAGDLASGTREALVPVDVTLTPSPAPRGQAVRLAFDAADFSGAAPAELRVVDLQGRTVHAASVETAAGQATLRADFPAGMYTVTLSDGRHVATARLTVQ